jgi:amidase
MLTLDEAIQIGWRDAHGQAALVRAREITAAELVEAAILRIEALSSSVNALSYRAFDMARDRVATLAAHRGALAGVPYLIKDSLEYPGMPARAASRSRGNELSTKAHAFIKRFDAEGLIPVGKSSMCEFGLLGSNEPMLYGPARNPWALDSSTGGSSGGAAAAVASGMVPLAHASDAAGSIRIPASCCGLVGLKASRGANVRARAQNLIDDLLCSDVLLSRSVRDVAWAFSAAHPESRAPVTRAGERRLRIAVAMQDWRGALPTFEVAEAVEKTAALCAGLGHRVERKELPLDGPALAESFKVLWGYLGSEVVDITAAIHAGRSLEDLLEPWTLGVGEWGKQFDGIHLEQVFARIEAARRAMDDFFRGFDVVLSPVLPERPAKLGRLAPTRAFAELLPDIMNYMSYTPLQNMLGTPAISLPLFTGADGIPLGSMFAANRGQDESLLALAYELESAQPWADRRPHTDSATRRRPAETSR